MKTCPKCGKEIDYYAVKCKYCGEEFQETYWKTKGIQSNQLEDYYIDEKRDGFGFGIFLGILAIANGALGILSLFAISTFIDALLQIVFSFILIVVGILILRRKKLGLYIVFSLLVLGIISALAQFLIGITGNYGELMIKGSLHHFLLFCLSLVFWLLCFTYFYRRRHWFN